MTKTFLKLAVLQELERRKQDVGPLGDEPIVHLEPTIYQSKKVSDTRRKIMRGRMSCVNPDLFFLYSEEVEHLRIFDLLQLSSAISSFQHKEKNRNAGGHGQDITALSTFGAARILLCGGQHLIVRPNQESVWNYDVRATLHVGPRGIYKERPVVGCNGLLAKDPRILLNLMDTILLEDWNFAIKIFCTWGDEKDGLLSILDLVLGHHQHKPECGVPLIARHEQLPDELVEMYCDRGDGTFKDLSKDNRLWLIVTPPGFPQELVEPLFSESVNKRRKDAWMKNNETPSSNVNRRNKSRWLSNVARANRYLHRIKKAIQIMEGSSDV